MADYARLSVEVKVSPNSDYSDPRFDTNLATYTASPTTSWHQKITASQAGDTTVDLGAIAAVNSVVIKNIDSTNYVTVTFRSAGNGGTDNKVRVAAGKFLVLPDVTAANDLILRANTADCICEVIAF